MILHLDEAIFDVVQNGSKNVEVRVNDEKRRKLKVGDKIVFLKRPNNIEKIEGIIEELVYFKDFNKLVENYNIKEIYLDGYTKEYFIELLKRFYSDEEVNKYGVVAIKFKKI